MWGLVEEIICSGVWGTPVNFNEFRVLASLLHRRRAMEVNQTLHDVWPSPEWYTTLCLKKVPTIWLSITLSNLNRFPKFLHGWKAYENLLHIPYDTTHHTLGKLLQYLGKLEIQIFCRHGRKRKQIAFLIASNFVIYPQILIFSVFKITSLSPYWLWIKFSVLRGLLFFYLFTFMPSTCARTEVNVKTVNDLVLSKQDKPQIHSTVREISWETGIHRWSSLSRIICKDLHLKCFKRRHAQELTDANCAARMKRAKLLLQKFQQ